MTLLLVAVVVVVVLLLVRQEINELRVTLEENVNLSLFSLPIDFVLLVVAVVGSS